MWRGGGVNTGRQARTCLSPWCRVGGMKLKVLEGMQMLKFLGLTSERDLKL